MSRKKLHFLVFFFYIAVACQLLSSGIYAFSLEFDCAQPCRAPDHERLGHKLGLGPAAKRPAVTDFGETRTLRLVYICRATERSTPTWSTR